MLTVMNVEQPVSRFGFFGPQSEFLYAISTVETLTLWECAKVKRGTNKKKTKKNGGEREREIRSQRRKRIKMLSHFGPSLKRPIFASPRSHIYAVHTKEAPVRIVATRVFILWLLSCALLRNPAAFERREDRREDRREKGVRRRGRVSEREKEREKEKEK